jgi:hypothetical protein
MAAHPMAAGESSSAISSSNNLFLNFPEDLRRLPRWVGWKYVLRDGKQTKPPFIINPRPSVGSLGINARANDPGTWGTFEDALAAPAWLKLEGLGWEIADPYFGIDLDGCRDPISGEIEPEAWEIINKFPTYWEISPSGTGVHGIGIGRKPEQVKSKLPGTWRKLCDKDQAIEVYGDGRYFTVTGNRLEGAESEATDCSDTLIAFCLALWPTAPIEKKSVLPVAAAALVGTDEELLGLAKTASNGAKFKTLWEGCAEQDDVDYSRVDAALMSMLAFWTGKDAERMEKLFGKSELGKRDKWKERSDYRARTIEFALQNCKQVYQPSSSPSTEEPIGPDDILPFESYTFPPLTYLVESWIVEGTGECWVGGSGNFKSFVVTGLGHSVSKGIDFCGLKTVRRNVLLIDGGENPAPVMAHRLRTLKIVNDDPNFKIWGDWAQNTASIPSAKIGEWIDRCDPKPLIIVDCLSVFFTGKSENDSAEMRKFFTYLADWKKRGATYLILHNRGKDESIAYRGTSAIKDAVDVMRVVTAQFDDRGKVETVSFEQEKNRLIREESLPKIVDLKFDESCGAFSLMASSPKEVRLADLLKANPKCSQTKLEEIAKDAGIQRDKVRRFIQDGLKDGFIRQDGNGPKRTYEYVEEIDRAQQNIF